MGRRGRGKGDGDGDSAYNAGQPHQNGEGKGKKGGKGSGKADNNGGYQYPPQYQPQYPPHAGDGKGNGWKGNGNCGKAGYSAPAAAYGAPAAAYGAPAAAYGAPAAAYGAPAAGYGAYGAPAAAYGAPAAGYGAPAAGHMQSQNGHGKGGGPPTGRGAGGAAIVRGGKGDGKRSLELELPKHEEALSTPPHPMRGMHLWPITPLGLPNTPPMLPPVNPHLLLGAFSMPEDPSFSSGATAPAPFLPPGSLGLAPARPEEPYVPVSEQIQIQDRREFFHNEGRAVSYNPNKPAARKLISADDRVELGRELTLKAEEVHFGNPRVRIRTGEPAPMPQMLKWPGETFDQHTLDCAEIDFGDYRVWSAIGIRSNRLLYAMKRSGAVRVLKAVVVAPPVPEVEDEVDMTYGTSIQAIQLVP